MINSLSFYDAIIMASLLVREAKFQETARP